MKRPQRDQTESTRRFTRRMLVVGGIQAACVGALTFRLRQMQVEEADQYRLLAEENRINIRLLPPVRGLIQDRDGVALATNQQNYRVVIVREDAGDVPAVLARLAQIIPLTEAEIETVATETRRNRPFVPITVAERLTWDQIAAIAANSPALPGITPEVGLYRHYPYGSDFVHVVGYVGPVSDRDLAELDRPDPVLQIPRFQIGKIGVERRLEDQLRGSAGFRRIEVNAVGRVMRELDRQEGTPGAAVRLTIDYRLQNFAEARLGEESAAAIVMDVTNGDLLAMASSPAYDPNLFVSGISQTNYSALLENERRPLVDKTVQGVYPPGSTFKMVTALAALEAGHVTTDEQIFCPGHVDVSGRRFHCWRRGGHGRMGLVSALSESCDVYFYELAQRTGIVAINAMGARLGIGQRFDLPMSGINAGLNPSPEWKRDRRGEDWLVGDTINASIGQGFVLTSPLQLAVMTARLATNRAVMPRLVRSINGQDETVQPAPAIGLQPTWLRDIHRGLVETVNTQRGTAYGSRSVDPEMMIAGKTGTSQVRIITAAERAAGVISNDDLPWNRRDHALFVSYAPAETPRYAVAVVVEHGGGGSTAAAPIARDIMLRALHGDIPPLSAYPAPQRNRIETMFRELEPRLLPPPQSGRGRA